MTHFRHKILKYDTENRVALSDLIDHFSEGHTFQFYEDDHHRYESTQFVSGTKFAQNQGPILTRFLVDED